MFIIGAIPDSLIKMPFKSKKQEKWMWANKPSMAKKWEKKYGTYHKTRGKMK